MTSIDRRMLLARGAAVVGGAAVTAIPAMGLCKSIKRGSGDDPLLEAIGRYRAEIAAVNASHGLSDEELDAWVDRADAILTEAIGLPVLTTAGAMAVIDLFIDDNRITEHTVHGDEFAALARAARSYIASKVNA